MTLEIRIHFINFELKLEKHPYLKLFLMKAERTILLSLFFLSHSLVAQKSFYNWYFGDKAGMTFSTNPPTALPWSEMQTTEGCATISDSLGNLLFYTDGTTVWNQYHDTLLNGDSLFGDNSSTQSALIVKQPGKNNFYYIFTADSRKNLKKGVNYSIVDMSLDNLKGAVIAKNKQIVSSSSEKISATLHLNKRDVWISAPKYFSDSIYTFLLTDSGLSNPIIFQNIGNIIGDSLLNYGTGQMKFSMDGSRMAYAELNGSTKQNLHLLDFDPSNGKLSNPRKILNLLPSPYGIEFSPNGKFLYASLNVNPGINSIVQFNMDSLVVSNEYANVHIEILNQNYYGGLQIGPDKKIYFVNNPTGGIGVINHPDSLGKKCNAQEYAIPMQFGKAMIGLPSNVLTSYYYEIHSHDTVCIGDSLQLSLNYSDIDSVKWDFSNGNSYIINGSDFNYQFKDTGTYNIFATLFMADGYRPIATKKICVVSIRNNLLGNDTILCFGDSISLDISDPSISDYYWNDGSKSSKKTIKVSGKHSITVSNTFCKAYDSIMISYGKKPVVFLGNDTAFCHKFSHVLDAGKDFKSYQWNTGENTYSIQVNSQGTYSVKVLDSISCAAADTILLDELKKPEIKSLLDTQTCEYVQLSVSDQQGVSYIWNNGDTGKILKVFKKSTYYVTASNKFCSVSDTFHVNLLPRPDLYLGPDTTLCSRMTLSTQESGEYLWNNGQTTPTVSVNRPGTYWLKISRNGCYSTDTILLKPCNDLTYHIPNAFSPNNDSHNDVFKVIGTNIETIHIEIYNRWGEKLLDTYGADPEWDGTYMGETCQQGVYCYLIEITGYNKKKYYLSGHVSLLR